MDKIEAVLNFWFGKADKKNYGQPRQEWFVQKPEFDQEVSSQFLDIYQQAVKGQLNDWRNLPESCLALIIILDQFPRNMFRNTLQAFATDAQALETAKYAISQGFDRQFLPVQRWFIYLPFEHSENLADQCQSVELFSSLKDDPHSINTINYAIRHLQVIKRFGRFPHRNQTLGRQSTPEELEFLQQPGSSF